MTDNADLLATVRELEALMAALDQRIVRLEATVAGLCGALSVRWADTESDQPEIIHDVAPNAPR